MSGYLVLFLFKKSRWQSNPGLKGMMIFCGRLSLPPFLFLFLRLSHCANRVNDTSPLVAAPTQVALRLPVGHTARAARTHSSHRTFDTLMVAPGVTASSVNKALPERPCVTAGEPAHFVVADPAMPPQMASSATFWSWKTMCLL